MEIAAKSLLKKVDDLLSLFSHFKVDKSLVERNEIRVNLHMPPPPPYPPPVPIIIVGEPNYTSTESALRVLSTNGLITNANNSVNKNTLARYETDQPLNPPPPQSQLRPVLFKYEDDGYDGDNDDDGDGGDDK